jgi:hypothetical protein
LELSSLSCQAILLDESLNRINTPSLPIYFLLLHSFRAAQRMALQLPGRLCKTRVIILNITPKSILSKTPSQRPGQLQALVGLECQLNNSTISTLYAPSRSGAQPCALRCGSGLLNQSPRRVAAFESTCGQKNCCVVDGHWRKFGDNLEIFPCFYRF